MHILMRTRASAPEAAAGLRRVVDGIDAEAPVTQVRSLNEVVAASVSAPRSLAILLLSFAVLALSIGGVGVYSLIAYIVSWRTREIGIRLAMGAMRWQIVTGVMKQSLLLALGGSVVGLLAASVLTQFLRSFLFGIKRSRSADLLRCPGSHIADRDVCSLDAGATGRQRRSDGNTPRGIAAFPARTGWRTSAWPLRTQCIGSKASRRGASGRDAGGSQKTASDGLRPALVNACNR